MRICWLFSQQIHDYCIRLIIFYNETMLMDIAQWSLPCCARYSFQTRCRAGSPGTSL